MPDDVNEVKKNNDSVVEDNPPQPDWSDSSYMSAKPPEPPNTASYALPQLCIDGTCLPRSAGQAPTRGDKILPPPIPDLDTDEPSDKSKKKDGGDRRTTDKDKPGQVQRPDNGRYETDGQGRVTKTVSEDGSKVRAISYDNPNDPSQVSRVTVDNFRQFVRNGDANSWTVYENGQYRGRWFGDIKMDKNGVYSYKSDTDGVTRRFGSGQNELGPEIDRLTNKDLDKKKDDTGGKDRKIDRDGDKPNPGVEQKDGATITRDDKGRVTDVQYPDGKRRTVEYDANDNVTKVTINGQQGKTVWTKNGENSWTAQDQYGRFLGWNGTIEMSKDGTYSITGSDKITHSFDLKNKQTSVREEDKPKTKSFTHDNGTTYEGTFQQGQLTELKEKRKVNDKEETITWKKQDGKWVSDKGDERKSLDLTKEGNVVFDKGDGLKRTLQKDGTELVEKGDRSVQTLKDGKVQSIKSANGDTRTFTYNGDQIVGITDEGKSGKSTWTREPGSDEWKNGDKKETRKNVTLQDGNVSYTKADGSKVIERSDGARIESDSDGKPLKVTNTKGDTRTFTYTGEGKDKKLQEIKDVRQTAKGTQEETWTRKEGTTTDEFVSKGRNGKEKVRENVKVRDDGDYDYTNKGDSKQRVGRLGRDASDGIASESIDDARENFLDVMKDKVSDVNHQRLQEMMKGFEERMAERYQMRKLAGQKSAEELDKELEKEVASTYDNLAELANNSGSGTYFDQKTRVKLAENFLFHAMDPTTMDQGPAGRNEPNAHGTCWIQSAHIWGITQHPGAMADLLKQVSINGQYTTKNNGESDPTQKTYTFSKNYIQFPAGQQEARWSIERATQEWEETPNMKRQIQGDRSPVGKIFDYTLPVIGDRREGDLDGGFYSDLNIVGKGLTKGSRTMLYKVTGDFPVDSAYRDHSEGHLLNNDYRLSLLEKGTVMNYTPGHLQSQHLKKVDGQWVIIQDNQHAENKDRIIARISDIDRWAKGDRSVERKVDEAVPHKVLKGSPDDPLAGHNPETRETQDRRPQPDPYRTRYYRYR